MLQERSACLHVNWQSQSFCLAAGPKRKASAVVAYRSWDTKGGCTLTPTKDRTLCVCQSICAMTQRVTEAKGHAARYQDLRYSCMLPEEKICQTHVAACCCEVTKSYDHCLGSPLTKRRSNPQHRGLARARCGSCAGHSENQQRCPGNQIMPALDSEKSDSCCVSTLPYTCLCD